jgi:DMSO reductase family type II enzyme heme b subunit
VELLQTDAELGSPDSEAWRHAREYQMDLGLAPPVHPSINLRHDPARAPMRIYLRAASDGNKLYLRLRWPDASRDAAAGRSDFADAAAVQFALEAGEATSFMMGAPNGPVNIWYWQAGNDRAQNLAAGGFGSTTRLAPGALGVSSLYRDKGEWVVVFSRPLTQNGEHEVHLENLQANMSFALWQGEDGQRDGLKHVSMGWVSLQPAGAQVANAEPGS